MFSGAAVFEMTSVILSEGYLWAKLELRLVRPGTDAIAFHE